MPAGPIRALEAPWATGRLASFTQLAVICGGRRITTLAVAVDRADRPVAAGTLGRI